MNRLSRILAVVACTLVLACGDDDEPNDAGTDAPVDTGPTDAGTDTGPEDAGTDTAEDAGPPPMADFSCVEGLEPPVPSGDTATFNLRLIAFGAVDTGIEGVSVSLCDPADESCGDPQLTDADGFVSFELDTSEGAVHFFLRATHPDYPDHVYRTTGAVAEDLDDEFFMVDDDWFRLVLTRYDDPDLEANAFFLGLVFDCEPEFAPGVTFSMTPDMGTHFYTRGAIAHPDQTETDTTGILGTLNLPPGDYSLQVDEDGTPVSALNFPAAAGEAIAIVVVPTPDGAPPF